MGDKHKYDHEEPDDKKVEVNMEYNKPDKAREELALLGNFGLSALGAGILSGLMSINQLQGVVNFGVALVSSTLISTSSLNNQNYIDAKLKNLEKYYLELQAEMEKQEISSLQRCLNLEVRTTKEFNLLEELVESGIREKSSCVRYLIQLVTIYYAKDTDQSKTHEVADIIRIVKELDRFDCKLLNFFTYKAIPWVFDIDLPSEKKDMEELSIRGNIYKQQLLDDSSIKAQDLYIASNRLESAGLIRSSCGLFPNDELFIHPHKSNNNKKELLDDFLSKNHEGVTVKFMRFFECIGKEDNGFLI
ncbi:hypothetical protein [Guptibacillus hwajinpoensis]|uniref:hypothetical protein n=1 Tax=Guptibacillus hwajinpoensis TaxID=208199 RepID=UPI003CFD9219